jgi:quercetin dioxygenase-like cupin family protein
MKIRKLTLREGFRVMRGNPARTLRRHRGADQWLYVIAGTGSALVKKKRYKLVAGSVRLCARPEPLPRGRK